MNGMVIVKAVSLPVESYGSGPPLDPECVMEVE